MSPAIRQVLFFALLIAFPVISYFMLFKPRNEIIRKAEQEIEMKAAMLDKLREATARSDDLARQNEEIEKSIRSIHARLPSNKDMDKVFRQVTELAAEAGLRIPEVRKQSKPLQAGLAMEQSLDYEIKGNFDGFYRFLLDLEQMPRITRIPEFQIKRSDDVDGEMTAEMVLSIYYEGSEQ